MSKPGPKPPVEKALRGTDSPRTKKVREGNKINLRKAPNIEEEFADAFPPYVFKAYRALFADFDSDSSGNIDAQELHSLLTSAGKKVSKTEVAKLIEEVDSIENGGNGDGVVSEREFLRMLRDNRGPNVFAEVTKSRANKAKERRVRTEALQRQKTIDKIEADRLKALRKKQQLEEQKEALRQRNEEKLRQKQEWEESERRRLASQAQALDKEWKKARIGVNGVKAYDGKKEDAFYSGMGGQAMAQDKIQKAKSLKKKKTKKTVTSPTSVLRKQLNPGIFEAFGEDFETSELHAYCQLFAEYDADGSGNIDAQELYSLLTSAGKKVSKTEIKKLIEEVDSIENGGNGDGVVSEREFLRMLRDNRGPNVFAEVTKNRAQKAKDRRLRKEALQRRKTADKIEADRLKALRKKQQLEEQKEALRQRNEEKLRQKQEWEESERRRLASQAQALDKEWKKARIGVNGVKAYDGKKEDAFYSGMGGQAMAQDKIQKAKSLKKKKTKKTVTSPTSVLRKQLNPGIFEAFGEDFETSELHAYCQLFAEYDADGSGNIDAQELYSLLTSAGKKVSKTEIKKLIEEVDSIENGGNGDGVVSEREFLRMLRDNRGPNVFAEVTKNRAQKAKDRRLRKEALQRRKTAEKIEADKMKELRKIQQLENEAEKLRIRNEEKLRQKQEWEESERRRLASQAKKLSKEWKKPRFGVNGVTTYDGEQIDAFDDGMAGRVQRSGSVVKQEKGWDKFAPPKKPTKKR